MPKLKKPAKNAFYFFMVDRRKVLEHQGYRFPSGYKDVAEAVYADWKDLDKSEKEKYEVLAKEEKVKEKSNMDNKFTASGESYSQVNQRLSKQQENINSMVSLVQKLVSVDEYDKQIYVFMKAIYSVEESTQHGKVFWPLELAMCAFNIKEGLKTFYWTLIDTKITPFGYASCSKETAEETGLPIPGDKEVFKDSKESNYLMKLKSIKNYLQAALKNYDPNDLVVFVMDGEMESTEGCIQWLLNNINRDQEIVSFFRKLKFWKIEKLMIEMSKHAFEKTSVDNTVLRRYELDLEVARILGNGCYDFYEEITCIFHNKNEAAQVKMSTCSKNVVLRRMYLFLNEVTRLYKIPKDKGHDIKRINEIWPPPPRSNQQPSSSK